MNGELLTKDIDTSRKKCIHTNPDGTFMSYTYTGAKSCDSGTTSVEWSEGDGNHYAGDCEFTYGYNTDRAKNPEVSGSKYNIKENVRTEYERNFFTQSSTGGDSDGFCCPHSIPSGEGWAKYGEYCQLTQTIPRPAEGCYPVVDGTATELFDTMFTDTQIGRAHV